MVHCLRAYGATRGASMVGAIAAGLGYVARAILALLRVLIGASGPLLVTYGAWLIYQPAAYIVAGGFILWMLQGDRPKPDKDNE